MTEIRVRVLRLHHKDYQDLLVEAVDPAAASLGLQQSPVGTRVLISSQELGELSSEFMDGFSGMVSVTVESWDRDAFDELGFYD